MRRQTGRTSRSAARGRGLGALPRRLPLLRSAGFGVRIPCAASVGEHKVSALPAMAESPANGTCPGLDCVQPCLDVLTLGTPECDLVGR